LDGHGTYENYAKRAKELGMTHLAITEHGNVMGLIQFYEACRKYGIIPIMGMEAYQARKTRFDMDEEERSGKAKEEFNQRGPHHLTVLAKNLTGYHNLIRLSSEAYTTGFYGKARIDFELLEKYGEGLIILTGCLSGKVQQHIRAGEFMEAVNTVGRYEKCVGQGNVFLEIHHHDIPEELETHKWLHELSGKLEIPLVPTGDCHYVEKKDSYFHDLMLCINSKATVDMEDRFQFKPDEFYLKSYDEMLERFTPNQLAATQMVANMCEDYELDFETKHFPHYQDVPAGSTILKTFTDQIREGAVKLYGDPLPQPVRDRLNVEVDLIHRMGYKEYMLINADIIRWANENGIMTGPGRGSAAGSLVAYCLGITKIDPLRYDLAFDRFLFEGKKSDPDIDLDIDSRMRDRVIAYCRDKYGADKVANIITFSEIKAKSAIRDATRVLNLPVTLASDLCEMTLPAEFGKTKPLEKSLELSEPFKKAYEEDEDSKKVIDGALGLEGLIRQDGVHAAGVVITPGPIIDFVPIQQKGPDKPVTTQWDMDIVDKVNLLKIDFLALRTLDVISDTVKMLKDTKGIEIDPYNLEPTDDETFRTLSRGRTVGIFQLESSGIQNLAQAIGIETIDHVAILLSLYRPGPMGSGMHHMYAKRKHGQQEIDVYHPAVKPILEETLGLMIYQEEVMKISQELAGYSALEADGLRKAIGKKKPEELAKFENSFVTGAIKYGLSEGLAKKIFSDIEYFGGYSFNKSHAYAYAIIAYISAYLKTHYPTEFMTAALTSVQEEPDDLKVYLNECHRMGIKVKAPSVRLSDKGFKMIEEGVIIFGLLGVRGIGEGVVDQILASQEEVQTAKSIFEWLRICPGAIQNKTKLEGLIYAGAFDDLAEESDEELTDEQKIELLNIERRQLGVYVTDHPMRMHKVDVEPVDIATRRYAEVTGVLVDLEKKVTKAGKTMFNYKLERL
jgi:DNA polymerase-3 subunit alpha